MDVINLRCTSSVKLEAPENCVLLSSQNLPFLPDVCAKTVQVNA